MPRLTFAVPHTLSQDEVVSRLKQESDVLRGSMNDQIKDVEEVWEDHSLQFSFKAFGMSVQGNLDVEPTEIRTTATVPFAAMMFKGAIEEKVRARLEEILTS
jgi:hypothetical protein